MKFILSVSILLVSLFASNLQAQDKGEGGLFTAAIVAGANLSQIDGDAAAGYNKIGVNAGGRGGIQFSKRFELSFEILYSQKGAFQRAAGNIFSFNYSLDYIEIPVEANLHEWFVEDAKGNTFSRIVFGAGVSYNQLLFSRGKENGIDIPSFPDQYRRSNVMVTISPTIFFTKNWGLNFRWSRSLYSIRKKGQPAQIIHSLTFRGIYRF